MFPLAASIALVFGGGAQSANDDFDRGVDELGSNWIPDARGGLVIDEDKVRLHPKRVFARAEWSQPADADPAEKCSIEVKVKLGRNERLHRRACVRIARSSTAFARVTVWLSPSEGIEKARLECGIVGEGASPPEVWDWPAAGPEEVKLELEAQDNQLSASFGSYSCTYDAADFAADADSTRFIIEAGGNGEVVRLDDFSAQWKEPPPP